jgi:hypothetical protein
MFALYCCPNSSYLKMECYTSSRPSLEKREAISIPRDVAVPVVVDELLPRLDTVFVELITDQILQILSGGSILRRFTRIWTAGKYTKKLVSEAQKHMTMNEEYSLLSMRWGCAICGTRQQTRTCGTSTTHPSHSGNADFGGREMLVFTGSYQVPAFHDVVEALAPEMSQGAQTRYTEDTNCHTGSTKSNEVHHCGDFGATKSHWSYPTSICLARIAAKLADIHMMSQLVSVFDSSEFLSGSVNLLWSYLRLIAVYERNGIWLPAVPGKPLRSYQEPVACTICQTWICPCTTRGRIVYNSTGKCA